MAGMKELRRRKRGERGKGESYPWDDLPLGQRPDIEIVMAIGADRQTVKRARRRRGIVGRSRYPAPASRYPSGTTQDDLDGAAPAFG